MNICMIAYTFYEGDNRVMRYAEALAKRGDNVDVIALGKEGEAREATINGVHVFRIQKRIKDEKGPFSYFHRISTFLIRSWFVVTKKHLQKSYQVLHVHSVPDYLVFAAWIPRLTGARIILDIHDILPELYASKFKVSAKSTIFRLLLGIEQISCAFANHVIIANHIWRERLISRSVAPAKCSVFLNYPDRSIFQPRGRTRTGVKFVMLYPGSLSWHQGLDIAIRAFSQIKDKVPNVEFHIYGEGSARNSLIDLAQQLEIQDRVLFHSATSLREVSQVIEDSDLGIIPKRKDSFGDEAFSTKTLEFMALGVPIIVSDTTVDKYYFNDQIVTFFSGGNADNLAQRMLQLIQNPEARRKQIDGASEFVKQYDWDSKKDEYLSLVNSLATRGA